MREFLQSFSSLSLSLALLPIKQIENALTPSEPGETRNKSIKTLDVITNTVVGQFGGTLHATFSALDNVQRGMILMATSMMWPFPRQRRGETGRRDHGARMSRSSSGQHSRTAEMPSEREAGHQPHSITTLESMRSGGRGR